MRRSITEDRCSLFSSRPLLPLHHLSKARIHEPLFIWDHIFSDYFTGPMYSTELPLIHYKCPISSFTIDHHYSSAFVFFLFPSFVMLLIFYFKFRDLQGKSKSCNIALLFWFINDIIKAARLTTVRDYHKLTVA